MHRDMWSRLNMIADEDSAREESGDCGGKPSRLTLYLIGGHVIADCHLVDGVNSLDDASIDVKQDDDGLNAVWVVPIDAIAAIHQTYPSADA